MGEIRKILVPVDFSDSSLAALRYARGLATAFGAEVLIAHVLQEPLYPFALGTTSLPQLQEQFRIGCSTRLAELVEGEAEHGVRARRLVRSDQPFAEIIAAAREEGADLILMATHGHGGLMHAMMGSTTERVLRKAPCPVLVVPPRSG